jgi:formylglycine-generating enzyme required for sulfatase activity
VAKFPFDAKQAQAHQQAWADYLRVPVEFTNGPGMRFRLIPPGEFQMGLGPEFTDDEFKRLTGLTREQDLNRLRASRPAHPVRITRPFYMQVDEVTSGHYQNIMGQLHPEMEQNPENVLTKGVAWPDAISFCNGLSEREGRQSAYRIDGTQIKVIDDANGYRLPTEAQWEYACRAGTNTLWYFGAEGSADARTFRNQTAAPNPFGLTALYGGANEWCWDATNLDPYSVVTPGPHIDPRIDVGSMRIKRGGANQDGSGANRFLVNSFARAKASGGPYGSYPMHNSGFGRVVLPLSEPAKQPAPSDSAVIPPQMTKPVDLLALVDPGLDVVSGEWKRDGTGFISDLRGTDSYLRLPVEPGEAFSLRVVFSTSRGNFSVVLPLESKGLELFLSGGRVKLGLKRLDAPTNPEFTLREPVYDNKRHELIIDVTRPAADEVRLQMQVDGQPAVDWLGTREQLAAVSGRHSSETALGISTFLPVPAPTRLLSVELTTTRGSARFLRPLPVASQPPPAKAPFDARQARAHQEAWAKHLGTTVGTTLLPVVMKETLTSSQRQRVRPAF